MPFPADGPSALCGMSEFGPLATTVADLALTLDVLAGTGAYRSVASPGRPLRIGVTAKPGALGVKVDAEVRAAWTAPPGRCGTPAIRSSPPTRRGGTATPDRSCTGSSSAWPRKPRALDRAALEPRTRAEASCRPGAAPGPAGPERPSGSCARPLPGLVRGPRRAPLPDPGRTPLRVGAYEGKGLASTILGLTGYMPFTPAFNLVGFPAASVPAGTSAEGLPLGVQLAAAPAARRCCCRWPASSRRLRPWPRHAPLEPVPASS